MFSQIPEEEYRSQKSTIVHILFTLYQLVASGFFSADKCLGDQDSCTVQESSLWTNPGFLELKIKYV